MLVRLPALSFWGSMLVLKMIVTPGSWLSDRNPISPVNPGGRLQGLYNCFLVGDNLPKLLDDHFENLRIFERLRPEHADLVGPAAFGSAPRIWAHTRLEAAGRIPTSARHETPPVRSRPTS